ncbi:hypothetical protein [Epilithonimonas xixisoli]|uniref:Outer membrane protein with beta-barrel domain n=1 Tax=Epilithonimonas xixisoli TaxID=1476462 RepID=A0A4R8I984_9FLAO|nr:hypothetical protein [Epilithonimonas xixisoli]TDX83202.1 hypothetical protein B0I22_3277 [Epilithonimonas xixisoli]
MKKNLLFLSLIFSVFAFGQSEKSKTMGFYISPNVQIGYNLGNSIKDNQNKDSPYYQQNVAPYLPNDFTYGIGVVGGYHLLPFFAFGTGIRYNFIDSNQHLLNWVIQPKFLLGKDDWKGTIELEYGKQFNHSNVNNTKHYGLKIGYQDSFSKRLNNEFGFFIYSQNYQYSNAVFVGVSLGVTIFSKKNYTVYGKD